MFSLAFVALCLPSLPRVDAGLIQRQPVRSATVCEARGHQERCWWEKGNHKAHGPWCSKNARRRIKKLDSPGRAPYHTPMHGGARSLGAAGATEGPARQLWPATLASPPLHEAYAHGVTYYSVFPPPCVHLFLCPCTSLLLPHLSMDTFPAGEKPM